MKLPGASSWIRTLIKSWVSQPRPVVRKANGRYRLQVEMLEDRVVPSGWLVTNTGTDAATTGSLPWAIAQANTDTSNASITFSPAAFPSATTIAVTSVMTLTNTAHSISLDGGGLITLDGANAQRFLIVNPGVTASVNGLVIQNMNYGLDAGAGILNSGTLTVTNTTFNYCSGNGGGALCNGGDFEAGGHMTVIGCFFNNNTCNGQGGGIGNLASGNGVVTVADCSFTANNSAAILNDAGDTMTVTNSTFVGNANTFGIGGAISNAGTMTISGCTISGNTELVGTGGGIGNSGTMTIVNTVVANNTAGTDPDFITSGGTLTGSNNVIGNGTGMTGLANGVNNNQIGTATNPLLVPITAIGNFGGALPTALLLNTTNPALNTGGPITSLQSALTAAGTSLTLANGSAIASTAGTQAVLQIDSEQILVSFVSGNAFNVVTRGYNGTTAAAHSAGASVNYPLYQTAEPRFAGGLTNVGANQDLTVSFTSQPPASIVPNAVFGVALNDIDQAGVNFAGVPITVHLSSGTLNGTVTGTTDASGNVTISGLSIATPGTYTITATVNGFLVATSASFVVVSFPPTVTAIHPSAGSTSGGSSVVITGTNFTSVTGVNFGSVPAASFIVNSATQITAIAPPEAAGVVDTSVTNNGGTSAPSLGDHFTYSAGPVIDSVTPNIGQLAGGNSVVIVGSGFTGATNVVFGSTPASSFVVNSGTQITAVVPAESPATVDVKVTAGGITSTASSTDHYTFSAAPTVTALSPNFGISSGGNTVIITGTQFTGATTVRFGGVAAGFIVNSSTQITATAPAETPGIVDVIVTTASGGNSVANAADHYTFVALPLVTALNTNIGAAGGGATVVITGANFTAATAVNFGAIATTSFTVNSSTQITAIAPAESAGTTVDVTVTNAVGTSAATPADQFTFAATNRSIVVTTNSDAATHTGVSLRDAITTANGDTPLGFVDSITFAPSLNGTTITLVQAGMTLSGAGNGSVTIDGAGQITVDGGNSQRFLIVNPGVYADVNGLVIQNMNYGLDAGVGILNSGILTVTNTTFFHCAGNGGGALCNRESTLPGGVMTVIGCFFNNNTCNGQGGGIGNIANGNGVVTVTNCSFTANNSAAILNDAGDTMTVTNSTFVGNANTFGIGGAISNAGTMTVSDCTISGNTELVGTGGGIGNSGTMTLLNTVVANNTAGTDPDFITSGGTLTGTNNVIGNGTGLNGLTNGVNNNQIGTATNPLLVPITAIGNFGGALPTALLLNATNPALNTGGPITSLQSALTAAGTSLTLANGSAIASTAGTQAVLQIDSEQILVSFISGNTFNVITRGYNGTTAAAHSAGASVNYPLYQTTEPRLVAGLTDVGANQDVTCSFTTPAPASMLPNSAFTVALTAIDQAGLHTANLPITLHLSTGTLAGTTTVSTNAAGVATFTGLSVSTAGTYTITATVNGFLVATSAPFTVSLTPPTVTSVNPSHGAVTGGASVIITGTGFTGATSVHFGTAAATAFTVNSPTQITAIAPAGTGTVDVTVTTSTGGTSVTSGADQFTYLPPPAVVSVVINGGTPAYTNGSGRTVSLAGQTSVVEQILVTFNEAVTLDPGAFTITNDYALVTVYGGVETPSAANVTLNAPIPVAGSGGTQFILTFQAGPGTTAVAGGTGNILDDGVYTLNTLGSKVHAAGQTAADNHTGFWALYGSVAADNILSANFGDGNSELFVDTPDAAAFKITLGSNSTSPTGPTYNVAMDANLDGNVDSTDTLRFKGNFGGDWVF